MSLSDRLQQAAASRQRAVRQQGARTTASRGGGPGRRSLFGKRPPAPPLNDKERKVGFAAAILAGLFTLAFWTPHLGHAVPKGHTGATESLFIGLAMAGLLAWGAVLRKRWILAFVSLYVGFIGPSFLAPASNSYISVIGLPFVALGGWLIIRGSKAQVAARQAAAANGGSTRAGATAARGAGANGARGRGAKEPRLDPTGRPIPARSKRYTPPKPPPKVDARNGSRTATRRSAASPKTKS